jgi:hypothetical protein
MIHNILKLRKCPIEYALYLGDDHYYPISGVVPYITMCNMMHLSNGENLPDEALHPLMKGTHHNSVNILFGGGTGWRAMDSWLLQTKLKLSYFGYFIFLRVKPL